MAIKYNDTIHYLYALQKHGIKLGLDNTIKLLSLLGNPQNSFKSVHIAGTNGKGSTAAMIASVLKTAGFKVGLFTSPHLVSFTERMRVNDLEIEEREVVELTNEIRKIVENAQNSKPGTQHSFLPTFFEFVTAMGFLHFKREGVEWAVVETGMGGRLDATNILVPEVSVITNISYDHSEFLGGTLREIAGEKAGIIKKGIPAVTSAQEPAAMEVIRRKAEEEGTSLLVHGKDFSCRPRNLDISGITFDYDGKEKVENLYVPLCGAHQVDNAAVAIRALEFVGEKEPIPSRLIREGLARTKWQGRLELIENKGCRYDFLIDGAHNAAASRVLADSLKRFFIPMYEKVILILGIMADKDTEGIMKPLLPLASETIFTCPEYERAASPGKLSEQAGSLGFRSAVTHSVKSAIEAAKKMAENGPQRALIVITGSFYTVGEAKLNLGVRCHSPSLARLR
jgi:dihydrofolate synthase/folylpolyglutamate synthase